MGLGRVKSCMSLYVCSNYCKHCSSNVPAGRQAEDKPHQFRLCLAVFLRRSREVHGPQRIGKPELLPHGMANVHGVSTKPLDQNSAHKWVKINTMLSRRDLYDLCRTPLEGTGIGPHCERDAGKSEAGSCLPCECRTCAGKVRADIRICRLGKRAATASRHNREKHVYAMARCLMTESAELRGWGEPCPG